jgi:hypothetical protein
MAYGVEVINNNGSFQFGSEAQEGLSVIDTGTIASAATLTGLNTNNEILCLKRSTTGYIRGNLTEGTSGSFLNNSGSTIDYLRLRKMTQTTTNDSGTYGLEIFNSSGTMTYSSRYTRGQALLSVRNVATVGNGTVIYTGTLTDVWYGFGTMKYTTGLPRYELAVAYFNYTANTITVYFNAVLAGPFGTEINVPQTNDSSLLVLKRN